MIARHPDAIGAALIVLVAIAVLAGGLTTTDPGFGVVSPAVFPLAIGALMLASAAWLFVDTVRQRTASALEPFDRRPLAVTAIAFAAFLAAFVPLGFTISGTAFFIFEAHALGSRSPARDAIASAVFVLAVYWLFVGFLTVDLPNGPLPF